MASAPGTVRRRAGKPGSLIPPMVSVTAALLAALALVVSWVEMPFGELSVLIGYLALSSIVSSAMGFLAYRLSETGRRSIQTKVLIAHLLGALVVIANIFVTAQLMFISTHDLGLLMLLLVFSALCSVIFGAGVAARMTSAVERLADGAREVARGNLDTHVDVGTNDELADLACSFNEMVTKVHDASRARERADQARRELVAAVSHDLRTPLTSIRAMLEAMSDGLVVDPQTIGRYHATMQAQVDHLSRLIDDLFELSQLDEAATSYTLQRHDLGAIVRDAIEGLAMQAAGMGLELRFEAAEGLAVAADPTRLARVVHNLLDNAFRHAPRGSAIDVRIERCGDATQVSVRDRGDGIDTSDLPYLFDRFYRGEKSRSRAYGGAGLGLAIAREIVHGHGGTIQAENPLGGGARFTIVLPLCSDPQAGPQPLGRMELC